MIYINECMDCGRSWTDDGLHWVWFIEDENRDDPELCIEPVLCNLCAAEDRYLSSLSRTREGACAKSLSSTPKVKVQPEENKNEQNPQYDPGNNPPMVSDQKIGGVRWRRLCHTARITGWLLAKFGELWQQKGNNKND